jgi:hypothetical protein
MITKTFGAGGTYATLQLARDAVVKPMPDDYILTKEN